MSFYLSNSDTRPTGLEPLEFLDDPTGYAPGGPCPTGPPPSISHALDPLDPGADAWASDTVWARLATLLSRRRSRPRRNPSR